MAAPLSSLQTEEDDSGVSIKAAAQAIDECDFLLVATGAGFSADSGLPTYAQVATNTVYQDQDIDYSDLCRIQCLQTRPSLFYGFWGSCFNAYNEAIPHQGYEILKKWCERKEVKNDYSQRYRTPVFFYTSNVDGHLKRMGFLPDTTHEVHGSIDTWMVSSSSSSSSSSSVMEELPPQHVVLPPEFRFPVCPETLELDHETLISRLKYIVTIPTMNWTDVINLRPRVLMFDDGFEEHNAMGLQESSNRYQNWEEWMELQMAAPDSTCKLVVLEIGCGILVPSVRQECHDVVCDTASRCLQRRREEEQQGEAEEDNDKSRPQQQQQYRCTHIRINPEHFTVDDPPDELDSIIRTISINGGSLSTIRLIDEAMRRYS